MFYTHRDINGRIVKHSEPEWNLEAMRDFADDISLGNQCVLQGVSYTATISSGPATTSVKRKLSCQYCGCISSKEYGTCEHCGAPLVEEV